MINVHFSLKSNNSKTGPIPVSTMGRQSCPDACPLKRNGCYGDGGPLSWHWRKVTAGIRGFQRQDRAVIVGFRAHGTMKRKTESVFYKGAA